MSALPTGYVSLRDARAILEKVLFAGVPERPEILKARAEHGINLSDGLARQEAMVALWAAVDGCDLRLMAVGGRPRRLVRLTPGMTTEIPLLREVGGLYYLRSMHPLYKQFVGWFGRDLADVSLAVRESEIHRVAKKAMRSRRARKDVSSRRGRPSYASILLPAIREIVDTGKWNTAQSLKRLTYLVNRQVKFGRRLSEKTVTRGLDQLYKDTSDRKFERIRRNRAEDAGQKVLSQSVALQTSRPQSAARRRISLRGGAA
jgi:hypothetical protein